MTKEELEKAREEKAKRFREDMEHYIIFEVDRLYGQGDRNRVEGILFYPLR